MANKGRRVLERGQRENAWSGRIQEWRSSAQTQVRYCAERGLSVWMLRKWIVKLGGRPRQATHALELLPIPISALRPAAGVSASATSEAALEIALPNGVRVRASGAVACELTRALARTLRCSTRC